MDHSHHNQNNDNSMNSMNGMNEPMNNAVHNMTESAMGMVMQMHGGFKELIVFDTWFTKTIGEFVGSCIGLILIAAIYEGIKSLREWIIKQDLSSHRDQYRFPILRWTHLLQTLLHMAQVSVSYFLMLVVMTYNSYIFGSIILGAGIGYFLFAYKRTTVIDVNEHCS